MDIPLIPSPGAGRGVGVRELTPLVRRFHSRITGNPILVEGQVWLLADAVPELSPVWDELLDGNVLDGGYDPVTLMTAAYRLLEANYQLTADEGVGLLRTVPLLDLVAPVELAIFGPRREHITYSIWARSALLANGLDPVSIPAADRRHVLDHLVSIGRAKPVTACVTSLQTASKMANMRRIAANCLAAQEQREKAHPTPTLPNGVGREPDSTTVGVGG